MISSTRLNLAPIETRYDPLAVWTFALSWVVGASVTEFLPGRHTRHWRLSGRRGAVEHETRTLFRLDVDVAIE